MESSTNIEAFLEKIKREGVEEANKAAETILNEANAQAKEILKNAENDAQRILSHAKEETQRNKDASEKALAQAGRDLLLSLKQQIIRLFDRIAERQVAAALSPHFMQEMIMQLLNNWVKEGESNDVEILLRDDDRNKLEETLLNALQNEFKRGLVLKPVADIQAGFRIGEKDGTFHYDFTEKGIAEVLCAYLNPRVAEFLSDMDSE